MRPVDRELLRLAVPALGALLAEPLYVLTDTAVVGHLGTAELGGLAVASAALLFGYGLCIFLAYGTTAAVARLTGAGERYPSLQVAGMAAFQVLLDLVTAAQAHRTIGPGEPRLLALTAWSTVHGLARLIVDGAIPLEEMPDPETSARMVTETLINGLVKGIPEL